MKRVVERVAIVLALVATAWAIRDYRRTFIKSLFVPSEARSAAPRLPAGTDVRPLAPAERVRVVLIDGLDLRRARQLPHLNKLCERGIDMVADVGFPTVSLPVQHVLWTGNTQQMSGVLFAARQIDPPPPDALPSLVSGSVAVSEAIVEPEVSGGSRRGGPYQFIVRSFGFSHVMPVAPRDVPTSWTDGGFRGAALAAVASASRLVFVHVLRTDTAGHKRGRTSEQFRVASGWADTLLGELITADEHAHSTPTRWLVLSDHGHTAVGGHGGAEPSIRKVRACISGDVPARPGPAGIVHLVDIHRALTDSLGIAPVRTNKPGRPLHSALSAPDSSGRTLPAPTTGQWAMAIAILAIAFLATAWAAQRNWWALPWWFAIACVSVLLLEATPSLSLKMVYAPQGRAVYIAALPGLCVLAVTGSLATRHLRAWRVAVAGLAMPGAALVSSRIMSGAAPPLMPAWTAVTSSLLVVMWCALGVVALVTAAGALPAVANAQLSE